MSGFLRCAGAPRRDDIDTLRAIACIALVSYHVVGGSAASGLELSPDHWMSRVNAALVDLRMPLFSFLSGLVFPALGAARPWPGIASKARRLLLPMAVVGAMFWLARDMAGHDQRPIPELLVLPYAHFWFLQATFLIMGLCLLGAWLTSGWLTGGRGGAVVLCVGLAGAALHVAAIRPDPNLFSFAMACRLAPFFAAGYLIARSDHAGLSRGQAALGLVLALAAAAMLSEGILDFVPVSRRAAGLALGLWFCLCLLALRPRHAALARLGRHSYAIYLFHVFFTAGVLEAVVRIAPGLPPEAAWPLALAAGLVGPALLERGLTRHPWPALLCLGIRSRDSGIGPLAPRRDPVLG